MVNSNSQKENIISNTFSFLSIVILILNFTAGIIGGIWLVILGLWQLVLYSVIAGFIMPFLYSIITIPALGLGFWGIKDLESKKKLSVVKVYIATFWQDFVLIFWVSWVFGFYSQLKDTYPIFPLMLSAYSTSISPIISMGQHEDKDSLGTFIGVFYAECYAIFLMLSIIFGIPLWFQSIVTFISIFYVPYIPIKIIKKALKESLICSVCSKNNPDGSKFCAQCGNELY